MKPAPLAIVLLSAAVGLGGCSAVKKSYDDSFVKSFRTSFMTSCNKQPGMDKYCTCVADDVLKNNTPEQLTAMQTDQSKLEQIVNDSADRCKQNLPH